MSEATPVFSTCEHRTLTCVLDTIIPPSDDGKFPGAGAIGLADAIAAALQHTPALQPVFIQGLAAIEDRARKQTSESFIGLSPAAKVEVLNEIASAEQGFFALLLFHTYVGYYQNGRVVEGLGLEPRPPHPKGYEMPPPDLTLLDPVRRRGKLYRRG